MPFNGSGTFVSLAPPNFPAVPFTTIQASQFNANMQDIFTSGLTNCITRDGQSPPTANLPMAGFRLVSVGAGSSDTDGAQLGQTLATRGQVGVIDWDTRITNGIFEATAASLTVPATHFPPTSDLGELFVIAQGALVTQYYVTPSDFFLRQKVGGVWSSWFSKIVTQPNFFINGGLQVWQLGLSLGSGAGRRYLADMIPTSSTGSTYTTAGITFPVGQTDVDPRATLFHRNVVTSVAGAGNFCLMQALMESVRTLAGRTITVSFYAKTGSSNPIACSLTQVFGTGGAPSATVQTAVGKVTTTTTWARYAFTVTVPSISGKTLGSNNNDYLSLDIWFDAGTSFNGVTNSLGQQSGTFDIYGIKVEDSIVVTPFETPGFTQCLQNCQRFYYVTTPSPNYAPLLFSGNVTTGNAYSAWADFPVAMRASPSITATSTFLQGFPAANPTPLAISTQGFMGFCTANATTIGAWSAVYAADARL